MGRMPYYPGLADRIQQRISELGIPPHEFWRKHGYPPSSFHHWRQGRTPSPETMTRLASDLGVPEEWLKGTSMVRARKGRRRGRTVVATLLLGLALWVTSPTHANYADSLLDSRDYVKKRRRNGNRFNGLGGSGKHLTSQAA